METDSEKMARLEKENKRLIAKNNRLLDELRQQREKTEQLFSGKFRMSEEICALKLRLMAYRGAMNRNGIDDYKAIDLKYPIVKQGKIESDGADAHNTRENEAEPVAEVQEISASLKRARME